MTEIIIHAEHLFGRSNNMISAFQAVTHSTPYDELMSRFLCMKYAVQEMRIMQKKREQDLSSGVWEQAAIMEKQVDAIVWNPL